MIYVIAIDLIDETSYSIASGADHTEALQGLVNALDQGVVDIENCRFRLTEECVTAQRERELKEMMEEDLETNNNFFHWGGHLEQQLMTEAELNHMKETYKVAVSLVKK